MVLRRTFVRARSENVTARLSGVPDTFGGGSDPRTFQYDAAGRTTAILRASGTTTFTYDIESRVTSIMRPGMITNTFAYNWLDTRISLTDSQGTRTFRRNGVTVTAPVLADGAATYTPTGELRAGQKRTFHAGLKSTDTQTSPTGTTLAQKQYDAFGNTLATTGTPTSPFHHAGPYRYQSHPDHNLQLLGHRHYDPSTGRFLTRDPIKDGRNWYIYCDNSPVRRFDNSGLAWHDPVRVAVDPDFRGHLIAFGDFSWMKTDSWRDIEVKPGFITDQRMDVDFVVIIQPDGTVTGWFLPGRTKGLGSTTYYVDKNGVPRRDPNDLLAWTPYSLETLDSALSRMWLVTVGSNPLVNLVVAGGRHTSSLWATWIDDALKTGFPSGFEPKPHKLRR